jgi:hypothetical protein
MITYDLCELAIVHLNGSNVLALQSFGIREHQEDLPFLDLMPSKQK